MNGCYLIMGSRGSAKGRVFYRISSQRNSLSTSREAPYETQIGTQEMSQRLINETGDVGQLITTTMRYSQ